MLDQKSFIGRRILVTGGSSGIGRATAILLSRLGGQIVLTGRSGEKLSRALSELDGTGHCSIPFDLRDFDSYDDLMRQCGAGGKLDGLVHCAGIAKPLTLKTVSPAAIAETMDTNFVSFMLLAKYLSKKKHTNDGASLVAVSAVNVHYPQKCMSVYAASKAALEAAVRTLALELYPNRRLRVNALVVGPVATPMGGAAEGDLSLVGTQSEITPNLMGIASPDDIAKMAAILLDDSSAYVTGRNFYVDGGRLG